MSGVDKSLANISRYRQIYITTDLLACRISLIACLSFMAIACQELVKGNSFLFVEKMLIIVRTNTCTQGFELYPFLGEKMSNKIMCFGENVYDFHITLVKIFIFGYSKMLTTHHEEKNKHVITQQRV